MNPPASDMQDIVEQALANADEAASPDTDTADAAEFGPPKFAFVGCGDAGVRRASESVESGRWGRPRGSEGFDVTTVTIESADPEAPTLGDGLADRLDDIDIAVVTAHLTDSEVTDLAAAAVGRLPADAIVLAIVSVPETPPATDRFSAAFSELAERADTTIPIGLGRVRDGFGREGPTETDGDPHALVDDLVGEVAFDVFEMAAEPLAAPLNLADFYDLLESGGVALTYRGWGTRTDIPADLLDHAVAHRLWDGDPDTADGGFGFCRFGSELLLGEYETLFADATDRFAPPAVERDRWLHAGNSAAGLGEECRLTLVLTGIDPDSPAFFDSE